MTYSEPYGFRVSLRKGEKLIPLKSASALHSESLELLSGRRSLVTVVN